VLAVLYPGKKLAQRCTPLSDISSEDEVCKFNVCVPYYNVLVDFVCYEQSASLLFFVFFPISICVA